MYVEEWAKVSFARQIFMEKQQILNFLSNCQLPGANKSNNNNYSLYDMSRLLNKM